MNGNRLLLITGGSRGIGAAVARGAAEAGWDVALTYRRNEDEAKAVAQAVRSAGRDASIHACDTARPESIAELFAAVDALGRPLHGLVNNAGIVAQAMPLVDMDDDRIARMFAVNTTGAFLVAREGARRMAKSRGGEGGVIVNTSSIAAKLGGAGSYVDYAASKAAIDTLTHGLGLELAGDGVRVCGVRPGVIDTEIHADAGTPNRVAEVASSLPMKRAGSAAEVADTILWLLSDKASYVTGTSIDISGGR